MTPKSNKLTKTSPGSRPVHDHGISHARTLTPETLGRKGFLALPDELVYMIFSYYSEIRVEYLLVTPTYSYLPGHFLDRFKALRSLSQLCQLSRRMYLPLLWERVQICISTGGAWYRELGNSLLRKCNGLLESHYLWPYVRTITVCITRFEMNRVLPPFVQLLETLPNIQTLEIPHVHRLMTSILKSHFHGHTFPTIRRVVMPTCAHEILRCCPGIQDVTCNEGDGGTLVSAMASTGCHDLQAMDGIAAGPVQMRRLVKRNPPLKRVRINVRMGNAEKNIKSFSKFPSLRIIELDSDDRDVDNLVKVASDALRSYTERPIGSSGKRRKGETKIDTPDGIHDRKVVRVLRFGRVGWKDIGKRETWTPEQFIPRETKEFPVA